MTKYAAFLFIIFLTGLAGAAESDLLILKNDSVVLGVKAELGGRVMLFRRLGGVNVLDSNTEHWSLKDKDIPAADHKSSFVEYNGHIVWIGPYSKWWTDNDDGLTPPNTGFCPDPYLIYDRYEVVEHTPLRLVLQGHVSPLNGMSMKKEFELDPKAGHVKLTVYVTNTRNRPVTWDIWTNTRFNPVGSGGFSVVPRGNLKYDFSAWYPQKERPLQYEVKDGFASFVSPPESEIDKYSFYGKLSFNKYRTIRAVLDDNLFTKKAIVAEGAGNCSEGHSPVEVYQRFTKDSRANLLELEFHSPAFELKPGETTSFAEMWTLEKTKK